ncbi:MAG: hypothetical protein GF411_06260 [Candidatus Lokiarchaeota archaeon]|nr:hypothetical protein [Candidatus Lokiarchaeota archaeon]
MNSEFLVFAITNVLGAVVIAVDKQPQVETKPIEMDSITKSTLGRSIYTLILAAAIDAFVIALRSPIVEIYILDQFREILEIGALVYLPNGILSAIFRGHIGKIADNAKSELFQELMLQFQLVLWV